MTVSMRAMSAGDGYRYLIGSVIAGDGPRDRSLPLVEYYAQSGTPAGRWLGSGLSAVGLAEGAEVTEDHLALLLGAGRHPVNGGKLGHAYPRYSTVAERVAARLRQLPAEVAGEAADRITAEEAARPSRRAVAGYDLTFSVPKSVSVWWALADDATRRGIVEVHHAAVRDVLALMERDVAATRAGAKGPHGGVLQLDVDGLMAAAFDHWDSRAGDPQLHTHVVVSNKVRTSSDGRWRALDGRPLHAALVALSEHYNALLADGLTGRFGVDWEQRQRGRDRTPAWEIATVPQSLVEAFSQRSRRVDEATDRLVDAHRTQHGTTPGRDTVIRLRQQATLATRPAKQPHSLAALTRAWSARAREVLGFDAAWLSVAPRSREQSRASAGPMDPRAIDGCALVVLDVVSERRTTWTRWNLVAEATRQTMHLRYGSTAEREEAVAAIVASAQRQSLPITPPDLAAVPADLQRADGSSRLRPRYTTRYTSRHLLDAEDRLVRRSRSRRTGLQIPPTESGAVAAVAAGLSVDQRAAVDHIATSGLQVDLLVGPAGTGKTRTLAILRALWEQHHGPGSVVGLAPSAAAAAVLGEELRIPTDNTAKWLHDHTRNGRRLESGQLLIIDEASLASTRALDLLTGHAQAVGAKVLMVGDPQQLGPVGAGGVLGLLAGSRADHPRLEQVHRFHHEWEREASLRLRDGNLNAVSAYAEHGRLHEWAPEEVLQRAHDAWRADVDAGMASMLIAPSQDQVTALNQLARNHRQVSGEVEAGDAAVLHDGTAAGVGDWVITRRNARRHRTSAGRWIRNGDRWTVTQLHVDGSLTLTGNDQHGGEVTLPGSYVAAHVDLGYAITTHRAQGATVDTAHCIIGPSLTRESLYVALTRGRQANHAWIDRDDRDGRDGSSVLADVLRRTGQTRSATESLAREQDRWTSTAQLIAEYETIAVSAGQTPTAETARALAERRQLLHQQGDQLLRNAIAERQPWVLLIGKPPADRGRRREWLAHARTIALHRDRHEIKDPDPLGRGPKESLPGAVKARLAARALQDLRRQGTPSTHRPAMRDTSRGLAW